VTIPEAAYIHFRRRPPEDERILINVLYVNKQEFCASSWRLTKFITVYVNGYTETDTTGMLSPPTV